MFAKVFVCPWFVLPKAFFACCTPVRILQALHTVLVTLQTMSLNWRLEWDSQKDIKKKEKKETKWDKEKVRGRRGGKWGWKFSQLFTSSCISHCRLNTWESGCNRVYQKWKLNTFKQSLKTHFNSICPLYVSMCACVCMCMCLCACVCA